MDDPSSDELDGTVRLPVTDFMYTLDQVARLLNVQIESLSGHVRFLGVNRRQPSPNKGRDHRMKAVSILPTHLHQDPEWRIPQGEVVRYLKAMKLVVYERKYRPTER